MDQITIRRANALHPKVREEVISLLADCQCALTGRAEVRIVQGLRTFAEQDALYAQGRAEPGLKVTNAKGGQSYHNYGLAFDFALLIDGKVISWDTSKDWDGDTQADWLEVIQLFVRKGWKWGKAFNDLPHLEKSFGFDHKQLLVKYKNGEFIQGTKYLNI